MTDPDKEHAQMDGQMADGQHAQTSETTEQSRTPRLARVAAVPPANSGTQVTPASFTRRGNLGTTLKLSAAAAAAIGALPLGTALAQSGPQLSCGPGGPGAGSIGQGPFGLGEQPDVQFGGPGSAGPGGSALLCRVSEVPDGDFDKGSQGGDSLASGMLMVARAPGDAAGRVVVMLDGAAHSATYEVKLVRFKDHGRETIGQVSTDGAGRFGSEVQSGGSAARLPGNRRIGAFVLTRDGKDQFVTGYPTEV